MATVWEPGMPTVAGVPWRIGKELKPVFVSTNLNCALPHLPLPLLPDRTNLIIAGFSVMHVPHAF